MASGKKSSRKKSAPKTKARRKTAPAKPAPKKKKPKLNLPSGWFIKLGEEKARETYGSHPDFRLERIRVQAAARREQRAFFARDIKMVRKLFSGFDVADGYRVDNFDRLTAHQYKEFRKYASLANYITSEPTVLVKPRSKAADEALAKYTGQKTPRQRRYAVHVDDIKLDRVKVTRTGRIQIIRRLKGVELVQQDYIFEEFFSEDEDDTPAQAASKEKLQEMLPPMGWEEVIRLTRGLLRYMPNGNYVLLTLPHGPIYEPMAKADIILNLRLMMQRYDNKNHEGFPELIIGFRRMSHNIKDASRAMRELRERRLKAREERHRDNRLLRQTARRRHRKGIE